VTRGDRIVGCLLGTAVGDALGLPYEGLSPRRAARLLGPPDRYRFLLGRGMVSDDTEHACFVAQALLVADDPDQFAQALAAQLRGWLLGLPAGVGLATARAVIRLWCGIPPTLSGVFSAGNGPLMRAAILGAAIDDLDELAAYMRTSSRITHTDPKAERGALAIALAARMACESDSVSTPEYLGQLRNLLADDTGECLSLAEQAAYAATHGVTTTDFAKSLGLTNGVSGYVYHTLPIVLHAWIAHSRDYASAVRACIECGGDADTSAAVVGGLVGAAVGQQGIPEPWLAGLLEWPRTVRWMETLGQQLGHRLGSPAGKVRSARLPPGQLPRNLLFLGVVLGHGFRRLLPPY
jgi:ADP-ribosyl-[dinitrogen reductase] hydrolase